MRSVVCFSTAALLFLSSAAPAQNREPLAVRGLILKGKVNVPALGPGASMSNWSLARESDPQNTIQFVSILVDSAQANAAIRDVRKYGRPLALLSGQRCERAIAITNGGFYLRQGTKPRPLGLVRVSHKTLFQPSGRRFGGFLLVNDGGALIAVPRSEAAKAATARDAIESSPMIVEGGKSGMRSDDGVRFDRVGIGRTRAGRTMIVGAFGSDQDTVSLHEFAELTLWAATRQGDAAQDVIALDGGPSAHLFLPGLKTIFGDGAAIFLPNAVCVGGQDG